MVRIDDTDPVTTADIDEAWQNGPVTVTLTRPTPSQASQATYYRIDGGAETTYTAPFEISAEGTTTVEYWSVDVRGQHRGRHERDGAHRRHGTGDPSDIDEAWQTVR